MREMDTKGWTQVEKALAEVILWGGAWAIETPTKIEARCRNRSCWNRVVLEVSLPSIEEKPCVDRIASTFRAHCGASADDDVGLGGGSQGRRLSSV